MKVLNLSGQGIVIGDHALEYLKQVKGRRVMLVTGGQSMQRSGVIDRAVEYLSSGGAEVMVYGGIKKNPTIDAVMAGLEIMKKVEPDVVVAIGGGSPIDAMKAMVLFYEFPYLNFNNVLTSAIPLERKKVIMIVVPSTSGTGSEITRGTVITDPDKEIKVPIMTPCMKPDIAILDAGIVMTMPPQIAAETGMDALTHAMEAYTNHALDDFNEVIAKGAIAGLMEWLPVSCEKRTLESRRKVHHYQCMAGISFTNVGLGMVHGIAHSFGAKYDMAHGLTNAVILPFVLEYNRRDPLVAEKLKKLSLLCGCEEIVEEIKMLKKRLNIPYCFKDTGIREETFKKDFAILVDHAMMGATRVNPVTMTTDSMEKMVKVVYYGTGIDF